MSKSLIPMRPEGFVSKLNQDEQSGLSYYIISGCPKKDAFILFCRPDMLSSRAASAIGEYVNQFFARKEVKDYLAAYEETLAHFLSPEKNVVPVSEGAIEERKAKAKKKLTEFAMSLANNIDQAADPEAVLKIADRIGLLDVDETASELPRRYLPTQCGECRYRQFCEDNTEDECQYCKYKKFGEDNGVHFDPEHQLEK